MLGKINKDVELEKLALHLEHLFDKNVNFKERIITVAEDITPQLFLKFDAALSEMESHSRKAVTIRLFSEGGDEYSSMAIVGRFKNSPCKVIVEGYGQIASAATLIFAAGDHRRISKHAIFMHHEGSYEINDKHQNVKATVEHLENLEKLWASWMAQYSNKSKNFYYESAKHTDKYWSPEYLIKLGLADEII